ncbi:MAG TPA: galactose-1-phosphate uridylyltransferase [Actinomycetota bacterium]|nr:galactose-1-phosphate uridylyltransferase [Actinomycetota bacterium]
MSTLRQDPTTRQWSILAPRRGTRPHAPVVVPRPDLPEHEPSCAFCPGNEDQTPPEILRHPADPAWQIRVVPNMYAALSGDGAARRSGGPFAREMPGAGSHEVVIESPRHDLRMDEMTHEEAARVVRAWRERYRDLIEQPHIRAVVVFKNFGPLAGTSLVHPHSQIVATPVFLPRLLRRLDVATAYYDENGACVYDEVIAAEREAGDRMVDEYGSFVAFEPWAANSPFETWIAPTFHQGSFGDLADEEIDDLAAVLVRTLSAVRRACGDPDFNLVMYSAPTNGGHAEEVFHWHLKLIPKLSTPAGFEIGSAMSINIVEPEAAALALRGALHEGSAAAHG